MTADAKPNGSQPSGGEKTEDVERLDYGVHKKVNPLIGLAVQKLAQTDPSDLIEVYITEGRFQAEIPKWFQEKFPYMGKWRIKPNGKRALFIKSADYSYWVYFFGWVMNDWVFFPSAQEIAEYNSEDVGEFKRDRESRIFWLIEMAAFLHLEGIRDFDQAICEELHNEFNTFFQGPQEDEDDDDESDGECHDTIGDALAYFVKGSKAVQPFYSVIVNVVAEHIVSLGSNAGKFNFIMTKHPEIAARVTDLVSLPDTSESEGSRPDMVVGILH